ncbi:MAG: hypothetical protein LBR23_05495, partial [Spirochaetaceae bacterium]|nr:hypothetical protein [Spirochaetaceae bacterium]
IDGTLTKIGIFFYYPGGKNSSAYFGKATVEAVNSQYDYESAFNCTIDTDDMVNDDTKWAGAAHQNSLS